jgi:hypothetical protein
MDRKYSPAEIGVQLARVATLGATARRMQTTLDNMIAPNTLRAINYRRDAAVAKADYDHALALHTYMCQHAKAR